MRGEADAIVVLGCKVFPGGEPSPALERRASRALAAFEAGLAPRIITSGGRAWYGHVEADVVAGWLVQRGVPASRIEAERLSLTTVENAIFVAALAARRGLRRLVVTTCDWHVPRALATFGILGVEVDALPATAPPAGMATRARRALHEWGSRRLDARAIAPYLRASGGHPFRALSSSDRKGPG